MTARRAPPAARDPYGGDRTGTILGAFAAIAGGGAVLFFWLIGAVDLLRGGGGLLVDLRLEGMWRTLYLAYPFAYLAALLAGGVLAGLRRDLEAVGVLGLPLVAAVAYYLALVHLRPL